MTSEVLGPLLEWAAEKRLSTPVQLFCEQAVTSALATLRSELNAKISYAVKANTHPLMLSVVRHGVDEYNVTNAAHLRLLLDEGIEPERIAYVNPVLDDAAMLAATESGITRFVIDDERGLRQLLSHGADFRLTLRLRPDHDGRAEHSIIRFGAGIDALASLAVEAQKAGCSVDALSFFIGTHAEGLEQALPYDQALKQIADLRIRLGEAGVSANVVNIGGGFPGSRRRFHREHPDFFARISECLQMQGFSGTEVVCEPGRYLSEASMAVLTSVIADRTLDGRRLTYLDASGYSCLFETTFIDQGGTDLNVVTDMSGPRSPTQLLGPIMDSFDIVKRDAMLPQLAHGDKLLLPNTGAYSFGYSTATEGLRQPPVVTLPPHLDHLVSTSWHE